MTRRMADRGAWDLERDATLRLAAGRCGVLVRVERGTVLLTREGDPEDHVVEPGGAEVITGKGLVVAWALTPAFLRVERAACPGRETPDHVEADGLTPRPAP